MRAFRNILVFTCVTALLALTANKSLAMSKQETVTRALGLASYAIGVIHDLYGQTHLAVQEFQKSSHYYDNYAVRLRLGADRARLGLLTDAVKDLEKVLVFDPDNVQAHYLLAVIFSSQNKQEKAIVQYEHILQSFVKTDPSNVEVYRYLAQLYYSRHDYQKAIEQFEKILSLQPDDIDVMFVLGALYWEVGDQKKAITVFQDVLTIEPDNTQSLNSLGYLYAERGEHLDEAKALIEKALELEPDNGAFLDSLGWVYFRLGDYEKAIAYLLSAEEKLSDPVIFDHLGDVYWETKDPVKAAEYWRKSLDVSADQPDVAKKLERIESDSITE